MSGLPSSSSPGGSYTPPPPTPPPPTTTPPRPSSDRQLMLILSYIFFLGIIPLIARKEDREITWHAKNGLLLFAAYALVQILWSVLQYFLPAEVGCALTFVSCAIFIGYVVVVIFAIMKAVKGERMRLPVISEMADK